MNKFLYNKWWKQLCQELGLSRDSDYNKVKETISFMIARARETGRSQVQIDVRKPGLTVEGK